MPPAADPKSFLSESYQGEVLGEALFALLAEREDEASWVARWRTLERLERHVKGRLGEALLQRGLPIDEDPARRDEGRRLAVALSALGADQARSAIAAAVRDNIARTRQALEGIPDEDKEPARFFLGHQQAVFDSLERASGDGASGAPDGPAVRFLERTGAPAEEPIPEGVALMPFDPEFQADPAAVHHRLLRRAPIHRDRQLGNLSASSHDAVHRLLYDLEWQVDPRKAREEDPVRMFLSGSFDEEPSMLFLDDPEHGRLRNLVSRSFTPRAVRALTPLIEQVACELLDAIEAEGSSDFDLIEGLAAPLPAIAIARILGVDPAKQAEFKAWSVVSSEAFFNPLADEDLKARADEAIACLQGVFRDEIARRRAEPADDLIGKLVAAELEGDRLSEGELVTMCGLLLIAGNVTTTDLIGNGTRALLEHPDELAKLRARPELIDNAVEEMLRFDPPVQQSGRIAPRDCEIDGVPVKKGQSVTLMLAAANRDPSIYPDPDRFDIEREDTHHHSFGGGAHLCLGAHLARAEARAALGLLVARFPSLRPANRPLEWKSTPGFRGLSEYRVRID